MTTESTTATDATNNGTPAAKDEDAEPATTDDVTATDDDDDDGDGSTVTPRERELRKLLRRNEKELEKLRKAEDERRRQEMTEAERLKADLEARTKELEDLKAQALRSAISAEFQLDTELAERLRGDTEEELREDAKRLAELVGKRRPNTPPPASAGVGVTGGDAPTDPLELHRRAVGARY